MARAPVPSVAEFRAQCVRPDAFKDIPDATILAKLGQWTDRAASYTGKHTKNVIVAWDDGFIIPIFAGVGFELMKHRGFNPAQGNDTAVREAYQQEWIAETAWIQQVGRGEVEPFVDDGANYDADGPRGGSSERSDAWTDYRNDCGCS
jgi:hypothetical protein